MGFSEFAELFFLAFAMSMDAFAVSVCKGLGMKKATLKASATCGIWFGGFQAFMPLLGFFLGSMFSKYIDRVDYLVAFGLLAIIGFNMLKEAFSKDCDCEEHDADLSVKTMFIMAVATSIDALAAGVALAADKANIWWAITLIGVITFIMCAIGVKVGNVFGSRYEKKAQAAGGIILILLGLKMLIDGIVDNFL